MRIERRRFAGGYRFRRFEGRPSPTLVELKIPEKVLIPLADPAGEPMAAMVKPAETVRAGQIIARGRREETPPALATVSGTVEEIRPLELPGRKVRAAVIRSDGSARWEPLAGHGPDWETLSAERLEGLIYASGVASLAPPGIPTRFGGSQLEPEEVEHVIVQETESEVYHPSLPVLLGADGGAGGSGGAPPGSSGGSDRRGSDRRGSDRLASGLRILHRILPRARLHLAFSRARIRLLAAIGACLPAGMEVRGYALEPKYPQGREAVLVPTLLGRPLPAGCAAADLGILILDVQTVLQLAEAVLEGKPALEKIIALSGPGFVENPHVRARIGTPLREVIAGFAAAGRNLRFVADSAVAGPTLADLSQPLEATHSNLIALPENDAGEPLFFARPGLRKDSYSRTFLSSLLPVSRRAETNLHGERRPCINCSYCEAVCPAGLLPHLLHRYVQRGLVDETLVRYRIFGCIDCNLCTYVCPSKIPVAGLLKEGKSRLAAEGLAPAGKAAARTRLEGSGGGVKNGAKEASKANA